MLGALKNLSGTLVAIVQTRLALLGNELQAQKIVVVQLLGLGVAVLFCAGLAVLFSVGMAISIWWEQRVLVLGVSAAVFTAIAAGCCVRLQGLLSTADAVFGASLAALQDDLAQLRAAAETSKRAAGQHQPGKAGE